LGETNLDVGLTTFFVYEHCHKLGKSLGHGRADYRNLHANQTSPQTDGPARTASRILLRPYIKIDQ
jgi:hypothetical protein